MNSPQSSRTPDGNAPTWTERPSPPAFALNPADVDALRLPDEPDADRAAAGHGFDADAWTTGTLGPRLDAWGEPLPTEWHPRMAPERPAQTALDRTALNRTPLGRTGVAQKRLVAGLLAIFLGAFGAHKFYLGLGTPGLLLLGLNVGTWVMAFVLGVLPFIVGLALTLPLAALLTGALGLFGLVEGLILLTRSDEVFARDYLTGHRAWL